MTPFARLLRNAFERLAKTYYEGPTPPERLAEMVTWFANAHPRATRAMWHRFSADHAREAWKSGYMRGLEHSERMPQKFPDPDAVADAMDPDWRWRPGVDLDDPQEVVTLNAPDPAAVLRSRVGGE